MPLVGRQQFCSKDCRLVSKKPTSKCRDCAAVFTPVNGSRSCCVPTCEVCGKPYRRTYGAQRACGRACGQWLWRQATGCDRTELSWKACRWCDKPLVVRAGSRRSQHVGCRAPKVVPKPHESIVGKPCVFSCSKCGVEWAGVVTMGRRVRRCAACLRDTKRANWAVGRAVRRSRRAAAGSEQVGMRYLIRRDKGICQLCGKKVRLGEQVPHPLAPTLDHVVPLALGGAHTKANAQLAHFRCNTSKGARRFQEQLRLVG